MIKWYDILLTLCTGGWWVFVILAKVNKWRENIEKTLKKAKENVINATANVCEKGSDALKKAENKIRNR